MAQAAADKAMERLRRREAGVAGHRLAALAAMKAEAAAQVDAAAAEARVSKYARETKAIKTGTELARVTNYKLGEVAKTFAKNIIDPDAPWKLQKKLKEQKRGGAAERRRAVRNIYEGGAQREAKRCERRDAKRRARWAKVDDIVHVEMKSQEDIRRIADERTERDVADTKMKCCARELGFAPDVDLAILEKEVKRSAHFEVGEVIYAEGGGALVFARVPELRAKFKAIGTGDARKREICDACHAVAVPLLKRAVSDHYEFFSREDVHRNGSSQERARDRQHMRAAVEGAVKKAAKQGLVELARDEAALRLDVEALQKRIVGLGVAPDQLAVVPAWCSWARTRGPAATAPLVARRAALQGQLARARGTAVLEAPVPLPPIDFVLDIPVDERSRKLGIALGGAGETTTAEAARREARKQAELADWAEREGLGHLLSPELEREVAEGPAPAPAADATPPPPRDPEIDAESWLAVELAPLSM